MASRILTLKIDAGSQTFFDQLRQLYFPPARNCISAHLTLFHQLPETADVITSLQRIAEEHAPFPLQATGVYSLGRGVAYRLESPALIALHRRLSGVFHHDLNPQDRQPFAPHVVVQNKVRPADAQELLFSLRQNFQPMRVEACGLDLWSYLNGPWEHVREFPFSV